jgi:hypothetical protein
VVIPAASLSTLAVMIPGPTMANRIAMRRRIRLGLAFTTRGP